MYPMHWYGIVQNGIPLWSLCEIETSGLDIGCDLCFCLLGVFYSSWSSNIALILFSILSNDLAPPPSHGCSYPEKSKRKVRGVFLGLFHLRFWEEAEWKKMIPVIYMTYMRETPTRLGGGIVKYARQISPIFRPPFPKLMVTPKDESTPGGSPGRILYNPARTALWHPNPM